MTTYTVDVEGGKEKWYHNGLLHREDGPAVEWVDGTKQWYQNGLLHRIDGPATSCKGKLGWWYRGKFLGYHGGKIFRIVLPVVEFFRNKVV